MRQYSLKFLPKENYSLEDYIVSEGNKVAHHVIMKGAFPWGVTPFPYHLLLIGPKSSGKTYLANLWAKRHGAGFIVNDSSGGSVIDDITLWDEKKLLFHFNRLHEERKPLLMTINTKPNFKLPDLQSRINSLRTVRLAMPDQEMVSILLMRYFSSRSLKVTNSVINYLEKHLERNFESIRLFIELLDDYSLDNGRNITIPLINKLLKV